VHDGLAVTQNGLQTPIRIEAQVSTARPPPKPVLCLGRCARLEFDQPLRNVCMAKAARTGWVGFEDDASAVALDDLNF
jgi:hypothetical protein